MSEKNNTSLTFGGAGAAPSMMQAVRDVLTERRRQIEIEGWSSEHDDGHDSGQMARAAACYALGRNDSLIFPPWARFPKGLPVWPWDNDWWKPSNPRRNLVKAAALIVAEIERLDRAASLHPPRAKVRTPHEA